MPRHVYVIESTGEETGLDTVHGTAASAIHRLREYYAGCTVPRGAVARLKRGETVWAEDKETEAYEGCARKVLVW